MSARSNGLNRRGPMGSSKTSPATGRLESLLGFRFRDPSLFQKALTHRSYCNEMGLSATQSYERLEFLGDAVLEMTVSEELYRRFPEDSEGRLTKTRSNLVRGSTLARVSRGLGLGSMMSVGRGVENSGGHSQESVLAAVFEAVVAAVYLDQGPEAAREFVLRTMSGVLSELDRAGTFQENPKTRLQEFLQGRGAPTPTYRLVNSEGPDHDPMFTVEVLVDGSVAGAGRGGRKSDAEGEAARVALQRLEAAG